MPNALDLLIVAALAVAFAGGWQLGLVARATSWLGFAVGLMLGARTLPWVVDRVQGTSPGRVFVTVGAVMFAFGSIGLVVGLIAGNRLRIAVSGHEVRTTDRVMGGMIGCTGVLFVVWLVVPLMIDVRQWPAQQARGSRIAQVVDTVLPEPPDSIQALGRLIGEDRFPRVLDALQPSPEVVAPPADVSLEPAVVAEVTTKIVRIEGVACRRIQSGSGFVIGPGLVATNAHVVAGESTTEVIRDDGETFGVSVVFFDPARDLAFLSVPGLDRATLELRMGEVGETGGVFGYPGGGELRVAPFEVARHLTATGRDIYNQAQISREVFLVAALLASGDSGAALVADDGRAIGIAFAVAPDREAVAYALTADELNAALASSSAEPVDTGACLR